MTFLRSLTNRFYRSSTSPAAIAARLPVVFCDFVRAEGETRLFCIECHAGASPNRLNICRAA